MRRALRPATFVIAAVLVSLAACSSPTAPARVKQVAPAAFDGTDTPSDTPTDTTSKSGTVLPNS